MPPSYSATFFLLLLFVVAVPFPPTAAAKSRRASTTAATAFGRASWLRNLTLLGSASILTGEVAVALTTNASDGIRAGRALFSQPVRLLVPPPYPRAAPALASFSTRFTFRISPSPTYGDGLAFILTSSRTFLGASNGFLGLYPSAPKSGVSTVAVELDTHLDVPLRDPDGNHVALDAGSIFSVASASPGVDLKAGLPITAWVEYRAPRRRLRAWFSYTSSRRPAKPALAVVMDLSGLVQPQMYVGFSASNRDGGAALHVVESWSFRTSRPRSSSEASPPTPPSTVPLGSPLPKDANPMPLPANLHMDVVGGVILLVILLVFCSLCLCHHPNTQKLSRKWHGAVD